MVRKVRTLMIEAGETAEFGQYLGQLRSNHGRKRNFMDALAEVGID